MMEADLHPVNAFVGLSYDDKHMPRTDDGLGTLYRRDYVLFLKRLRKIQKFRFYLVGEYGDQTFRPHYHAALFNFPTCERGRTLSFLGTSRPDWRRCCPVCQMVGRTWGRGDVSLGVLETDSAQYLAQYTTKKMTAAGDPRLLGRAPEFSAKSLKPGLGADYLHYVAHHILELDLVASEGDVPSSLRRGSRLFPIGRYLRRKLRTLVGENAEAPASSLQEHNQRMRLLQETAFSLGISPKEFYKTRADKKVSTFSIHQRKGNL